MLLEILDMELVGEKYVPNHRLVTLTLSAPIVPNGTYRFYSV